MKQFSCPSCSSAVTFKSEHSVYATCESCDSLLVRHDVNLDLIGKVAELQQDGSPLKVGTQGVYNGVRFEISGRIQVTYGDGFWNEWYLIYENGQTGWLGEAMGEYFVSFQREVQGELPHYPGLQVGLSMTLDNEEFVVTGLMTSRVVSFEGELPFIMKQDYDLPAADLRSASGRAATLDFSEEQPILFLGQYLDFSELEFVGCRFEGETDDDGPLESAKGIRKLDCTSCGAPQEIKGGFRSKTLICEYCDSAIDISNPDYAVIWQAEQQKSKKVEPTIPIGSKANFDDVDWEVIGFMRKSVSYSGIVYPWSEYLLFNHYHGYRWLTESDGHFNLMKTMHELPLHHNRPLGRPSQMDVVYEGETYRHFQSASAKVDYVTGEFYWRVKLDEVSTNHDYVSPPMLLSMEENATGIVWSQGIYLTGADVLRAFGIKKQKIYASGVAPNQPNPFTKTRKSVWRTFNLSSAAALAILMFIFFTGSQKVLTKPDTYLEFGEGPKETEVFEIKSSGNLRVEVTTNLNSRWAWFDMILVNQDTKTAYRFGKTIEYWGSGDGSRKGSILVSSIPKGKYVLSWQIETGTGYTADKVKELPPGKSNKPLFNYTFKVTSRHAMPGWFFLLMFFLIWTPLYYTIRFNGFESRRWSQSDHAA